MAADTTDILIAGGGIAGLSASCAFGAAGFRVVCVDPVLPVTCRDAPGADLRSTAFLQPARRFLREAGVWERLKPHAVSLKTMRIVDAGGIESAARVQKDFAAGDIGEESFGYNLPNTRIRAALLERIDELDTVNFRPGVKLERLLTQPSSAGVVLSDGSKLDARLVIAADGRDSQVRSALGIGRWRHAFGQSALTFAVTHEAPHGNVSTEVHRSGGPFTLVPLPDHEGRPSSAVVWMETGSRAERLSGMDQAPFEQAATERSAGAQGPLTLVTRRTVWPIVSQIAHRFYGPRTGLVAEAAHVMPPIGAQGLNTSLRDLNSLLRLSCDAPGRIGEPAMLRRYHCSRYPDVATRIVGVSALNRASMVTHRPLRDARAAGLELIYALGPLRKSLMRLGLGS